MSLEATVTDCMRLHFCFPLSLQGRNKAWREARIAALVLCSVTSQRELYQSYIICFSYILCQVARCFQLKKKTPGIPRPYILPTDKPI